MHILHAFVEVQRHRFDLAKKIGYIPFLGDGARIAFTPNFRKVGSLVADEVLGLQETCVLATVVVMRSGKQWFIGML